MMNYIYFLLVLALLVLLFLALKLRYLIGNLLIRFGEGLDDLIDGKADGEKMADNVIEEAEYVISTIKHHIAAAAFLVFVAVYLSVIN